jgi:hypothetical protein
MTKIIAVIVSALAHTGERARPCQDETGRTARRAGPDVRCRGKIPGAPEPARRGPEARSWDR